MTVTPSSPVVGIFKDRSIAEQAIDALYTAGFTSEQVRYSAPGTSGSILADLKSLFTGQNASSGTIANDLADMGLSNEDAQYYSHEHANGNTILAVSASGREQEALNVLHQYGAYNAHTGKSSAAPYTQQSSDYTQQPANPIDGTGLQEQHASDTDNYPLQATSQDAASPYSETPDTQPEEIVTNQNPEYQPTQPLTPGYHSTHEVSADEQTTPSNTVTSDEYTAPSRYNTPVTPLDEQTTPSDAVTTPAVSDNQATPSNAVTSDDHETSSDAVTPVATSDAITPTGTTEDQTDHELQTTQPENVVYDSSSPNTSSDVAASDSTSGYQTTTAEPADEFEQLQEQLQAAQQQLQDARAQLQAAKDHEAQLQTVKEREKKLQEARQQLQDIQAQIEATMAELNETHGRISQYS